MSKTKAILNVIKGHAYIEAPLQDYHAAKAVLAAMRCKDASKRLSAAREALNRYRVTAWHGQNGTIVLRVNGINTLEL